MIKILWLLKSKINSDFINKISDELELKVQISSSFEKETIYDVIILEHNWGTETIKRITVKASLK